MFTGIIEELGRVRDIKKNIRSAVIEISAIKIFADIKIGDSIAVNGACLTVKEYHQNFFKAEILSETAKMTNLAHLKTGNIVNLERAVTAQGRLGGHIVTGHVDGLGSIKKISKIDDDTVFTITYPKDLIKYIVKKGSIAVDGISLTVVNIDAETFTVHLISHTLENTNLHTKKVGDKINLETDIIGKYIEKLLPSNQNETITEQKLREDGY